MKVNRNQLANIFGVALTTVDRWVDAGCPVVDKGKKGTPSVYDTVEVFKWIQRDNNGSGGNVSDQLEKEKLRKLRRENDIEEGKFAPLELLSEALQKSGAIIVANLESLPLLMKRHWPEITGDQITMVKRAIAECRNTIADMKIDMEE